MGAAALRREVQLGFTTFGRSMSVGYSRMRIKVPAAIRGSTQFCCSAVPKFRRAGYKGFESVSLPRSLNYKPFHKLT
jgi:hypothetical protein